MYWAEPYIAKENTWYTSAVAHKILVSKII